MNSYPNEVLMTINDAIKYALGKAFDEFENTLSANNIQYTIDDFIFYTAGNSKELIIAKPTDNSDHIWVCLSGEWFSDPGWDHQNNCLQIDSLGAIFPANVPATFRPNPDVRMTSAIGNTENVRIIQSKSNDFESMIDSVLKSV